MQSQYRGTRAMLRLLAILLLLAGSAPAMVVELVPEARTMPAPGWVKPGIRLTWHMMSASRSGKSVHRAPSFGANAKDAAGNKLRTEGGGSASGQGFTEIIVVAVEPTRIIWEIRSYLLPGAAPSGPTTLTAISGGICTTPGTLDGYWMNPKALRNLLAKPAGSHGFLVAPVKENVDGRMRDAIALGMRDAKSHFRWVYDLETGILLTQGHSQTGQRGIGGTGADGTDFSGATWAATHTSFREVVQLKHPWLGVPIPEWVGRTAAIDYDGGVRMVIAGSEGVTPIPTAQRFEPTQVGKDWALMRRTMVNGPRSVLDGGTYNGLPVQPIRGPYVCGAGSPSGLWIPPEVLRKLTRGQEVCSSAVTGFRAFVHYVGEHRGRDVCVIRWESPMQTIDLVHDRQSGGLLRTWSFDRGTKMENWFDFAGSR
jgi:hypothetical protein